MSPRPPWLALARAGFARTAGPATAAEIGWQQVVEPMRHVRPAVGVTEVKAAGVAKHVEGRET